MKAIEMVSSLLMALPRPENQQKVGTIICYFPFKSLCLEDHFLSFCPTGKNQFQSMKKKSLCHHVINCAGT